MAAATWSLPFTPVNLSPGHTPKMVPTLKFVSTILEPSSGSNATLKPPAHILIKCFSNQRITLELFTNDLRNVTFNRASHVLKFWHFFRASIFAEV